jgi:hypothetical protein
VKSLHFGRALAVSISVTLNEFPLRGAALPSRTLDELTLIDLTFPLFLFALHVCIHRVKRPRREKPYNDAAH